MLRGKTGPLLKTIRSLKSTVFPKFRVQHIPGYCAHVRKLNSKIYPNKSVIKTKDLGIQKTVFPLTTKRVVRRKKTKETVEKDQEVYDTVAYATAEEINLESLKQMIESEGLYDIVSLPKDATQNALHVEAHYRVDNEKRDIFFFQEGAVVFWNMPEMERNNVLFSLQSHQKDNYDLLLVKEEHETIEYTYTESKSRMTDEEFQLQAPSPSNLDQLQLDMYTFSNALSLSVKLAIWEGSLENYIFSIESVLEELKSGRKLTITRREALKRTGELLTLRHLINLSSDLLDTPDFYWDRNEAEKLYQSTCNQLAIGRRVKVMNEKLTHCCEFTDLLREHLNDKHHTNLEWLIILLIAVEVGFEILRLAGIH